MTLAKIAAASIFAAVLPFAALADFKQITTGAEYNSLLVGKKAWAGSDGWFMSAADGKLTGKYKGAKFLGTWVWQDKYYCRNGAFAGKDPIGTDCQVVEFDGKQVRYTRDRGQGNSVIYTLK